MLGTRIKILWEGLALLLGQVNKLFFLILSYKSFYIFLWVTVCFKVGYNDRNVFIDCSGTRVNQKSVQNEGVLFGCPSTGSSELV